MRSRSTGPPIKPGLLLCGANGCCDLIYALGLCKTHHSRWHRLGMLGDKPIRKRMSDSRTCTVGDCIKPTAGRNMCRLHYETWRRGQIYLVPELHEAKKLYQRAHKAAEFERDPQRVRDRARAWKLANPDRIALIYSRKNKQRYAQMLATRIPFTGEQLLAKCRFWGYCCWICGGEYDAMDHVKPLAAGGPHILANLRPICRPCNSRKHSKWPFPGSSRGAPRQRIAGRSIDAMRY